MREENARLALGQRPVMGSVMGSQASLPGGIARSHTVISSTTPYPAIGLFDPPVIFSTGRYKAERLGHIDMFHPARSLGARWSGPTWELL